MYAFNCTAAVLLQVKLLVWRAKFRVIIHLKICFDVAERNAEQEECDLFAVTLERRLHLQISPSNLSCICDVTDLRIWQPDIFVVSATLKSKSCSRSSPLPLRAPFLTLHARAFAHTYARKKAPRFPERTNSGSRGRHCEIGRNSCLLYRSKVRKSKENLTLYNDMNPLFSVVPLLILLRIKYSTSFELNTWTVSCRRHRRSIAMSSSVRCRSARRLVQVTHSACNCVNEHRVIFQDILPPIQFYSGIMWEANSH